MTAWHALQRAMADHEPGCLGDERYITDPHDLPQEDREQMFDTCTRCPLLDPCTAYATDAKPPAGWWPRKNLKPRKDPPNE